MRTAAASPIGRSPRSSSFRTSRRWQRAAPPRRTSFRTSAAADPTAVPPMARSHTGALVAAALSVVCAVHPLLAQRPTPAQAQEMLRTRPELVDQLRTRLASSGLTPDQVRARLRAAGYPESMLDAYLPGSSGTTGAAPG